MKEHWKGQADGYPDGEGAELGICDLVSRPHLRDHCGRAWRPLPLIPQVDRDGHVLAVFSPSEFERLVEAVANRVVEKMAVPIRHVEPVDFDAEVIEKLFDAEGNWVGFTERREISREELEKIYPQSESERSQEELEPLPTERKVQSPSRTDLDSKS